MRSTYLNRGIVIVVCCGITGFTRNESLVSENGMNLGDANTKAAPDVIVYASELSESNLSEFDFANEPASLGGKMVLTPNSGDELDPPPENDPNVTFKIRVRNGIPYRCWVHMKVGAPKGKSQANLVWLQFSDAVDKDNRSFLGLRTRSYLTAQGPARQGWAWVGCKEQSKPGEAGVYFRTSGEVTVRIQAGMEGVGFDQFVLSPGRYLDSAPSDRIVRKQ